MPLHCCWLDDEGDSCGEEASPFRRLPLCADHVEAERARRRGGVQGLVTTALRYHELSDYPGACYFALLPDGAVKIGFSHTHDLVGHRMKALSRQYEAPVIPLRTIPGGFVAEAAMHRRFDHLRLPGNGERFELRDELAEFLAADEAA